VNSTIVVESGLQVNEEQDLIEVNGMPVKRSPRPVYVLMNKPVDYVVTVTDPQERRTVFDLLKGLEERVFPVGRLDMDVDGVLIFTNDGDLAHRLIHPRYTVEKAYHVVVQGKPDRETVRAVEKGLPLDDGLTAPVTVTLLSSDGRTSHLEQTMHEGKKRQVKRMWTYVGHPVIKMTRIGFAGLTSDGLEPGQWRHLRVDEIDRLKNTVRLESQEICPA
jgi:pseudouridine synthase